MRLLTKTIRNYSFFAIIVVVLATPAFYFILKKIFTEELDEYLVIHKQELISKRGYLKSEEDIRLYQMLDSDIELEPNDELITTVRFYDFEAYDSIAHEVIPFRALSTGIELNGKSYKLIVKESLVSNEDLIEAIVIIQGLLLILILTGSVVVNRIMSGKTWKSFYQTLDQLKHYEVDKNSGLTLNPSTITEFTDLNKAITQLVEKNYIIYLSQKEFTENAAHEMQTPLAIFQSKLELLMQKSSLTEDEALLINSLYQASIRLSRLNKNLLLLAKIENNQFGKQEIVNSVEIINRIFTQYQDQAELKQLRIEMQIADNNSIIANVSLMEILLQNLIANAIRYTPAHGEIKLHLNGTIFIISNSGEPLPHPERIFDRFHRGTKDENGTGLGLAIARKIAEVSGFNLNYYYSNHRHQFEIKFLPVGTPVSFISKSEPASQL